MSNHTHPYGTEHGRNCPAYASAADEQERPEDLLAAALYVSPATFSDQMFCDVINTSASDRLVTDAARVSTLGADVESADHSKDAGLINFLLKNRHMSPFEHGIFTWRVNVPIFVMRELHRHRIASYNEESGRYKTLGGMFYVPHQHRPLTQVGKPGHYEFLAGTDAQIDRAQDAIKRNSRLAWAEYHRMLQADIAKEVARMVLPVNIYSSCYVTMNPRALMNFLSLRTTATNSTFPSFPMYEIDHLAQMMEVTFEGEMPLTYNAWNKNGRMG